MESLLFLLQQWEDGVASTALKIRIQVTMLKFAIGLLASYPVAALLRSIPHTRQGLKHTLSMCTGLLLLRYVYGVDWMHGVVSTAVTYLICLLAPRKHVHVYVFVWAMGYMTLSHLYRMTYFYMVDQFDFTRTQMVLTMKLTSFAFNLYDGHCSTERKNKEVTAGHSTTDGCKVDKAALNHTEKSSANGSANGGAINDVSSTRAEDSSSKRSSSSGVAYLQRMAAVRARYEILDLPSPLEFCGYVFCFPNLLAGPAFAYQDYMRGIDSKLRQKTVQEECQRGEKENGKWNGKGQCAVSDKKGGLVREHSGPKEDQLSCALPAFHRLLVGLCSLIVFFVISSQAPIARQYDPVWQSSHSFLYRLFFISISFLGERFKFYFAWKVSEGACIMGGFGHEEREESRGSEGSVGGGDKKGAGVDSTADVEPLQSGRDRVAENGKKQNVNQNMKQNQNGNQHDNGNSTSGDRKVKCSSSFFEYFEKKVVTGWRGVENIDILTYETGTNIQSLSRAWNKRTQNWLEQYVYQRTNRSLLCTYAVSALWHGLYPGFFLFFFAAALMSSIERLIRVKINPLVLADPKSPEYHTKSAGVIRVTYSVLCWLITSVTLTYHAQTFYMRSLERSLGAFRSFYFVPNIMFIMVYFILEFAPTPPRILGENEAKKNI